MKKSSKLHTRNPMYKLKPRFSSLDILVKEILSQNLSYLWRYVQICPPVSRYS